MLHYILPEIIRLLSPHCISQHKEEHNDNIDGDWENTEQC
jgi:hypothetical protein